VGNEATSSNNIVSVVGTGSAWHIGWHFYVGVWGDGNALIVANGGAVYNNTDFDSVIGGHLGSDKNIVLVTDNGSLWQSGSLSVGGEGADNKLIVTNGGTVRVSSGNQAHVASCFIGFSNSSTGNVVKIGGAGSALGINDNLYVGYNGSSNQLVIADMGSVVASNAYIGYNANSVSNEVVVAGGSLYVTNSLGNGVLDVRCGKLILNGGMLQVDRFVMTNACAQFVRTGGTFIYGTAVLDPNRDDDGDGVPNGWEQSHGRDPLNAADINTDTDGDGQSDLAEFQAGTDPTNSASAFRIVEITPDGDDMMITWTTVGGKKYAVQFVDGAYTNGFTEFQPIIVAPGAGESTFSVIDLGAATNAASQFYRIRLVP
jgi:T5SS/PEP-CTERM-associated repeat protein